MLLHGRLVRDITEPSAPELDARGASAHLETAITRSHRLRPLSISWPSPPGPSATWIARTASTCQRRRCIPAAGSVADDMLESYIRQLIESHRTPEVTVAWQGGEPTIMGLDFFRRSMELEKKYARSGSHRQHHPDQRHAGRRRLVRLLREHGFLVGSRWPARAS